MCSLSHLALYWREYECTLNNAATKQNLCSAAKSKRDETMTPMNMMAFVRPYRYTKRSNTCVCIHKTWKDSVNWTIFVGTWHTYSQTDEFASNAFSSYVYVVPSFRLFQSVGLQLLNEWMNEWWIANTKSYVFFSSFLLLFFSNTNLCIQCC